jgi:predicted Fe-S protein YdhL (DUF1289 family)
VTISLSSHLLFVRVLAQNKHMKRTPSQSPASPCIGVCTIDEDSGYCLGCARNTKEVAQWRKLTDTMKINIIRQLPLRKKRMKEAGLDVRGEE